MRELREILFVSQGTGGDTESLEQALSLARSRGARLHALIAVPPFPASLSHYGKVWEQSLLDRLKQQADACASALQIDAVTELHASVKSGKKPAVHIIQQVLREGYDLLIKQAEPVDTRAGFSALDMQLLRQCPCPVWLCRPIAHSQRETRVAVAIDPVNDDAAGHELALDLLRGARTLADTYSGELAVVSCWDYEFEESLRNSPWLQIPDDELQGLIAKAEREHRAALDLIVGEAALGDRTHVHHLKGRPDHLIPTFVADAQIDILVMGSVARAGLPAFVMGNTAENVLRRLHGSLLVLKPRGFVSAVSAYD